MFKEGKMKTLWAIISAGVFALGMAPVSAEAAPGDANGDEQSRVDIIELPAQACPIRGSLCPSAFPPSTVADPSPQTASLAVHPGTFSTPRFSRVVTVATRTPQTYADEAAPWTITINASLRQRALAGNAVFLVFDGDDAKAVAAREVLGAWQATIPAGDRAAARLTLSPADGFRAGRNYRIRIVQIVNGKELILADGAVGLR